MNDTDVIFQNALKYLVGLSVQTNAEGPDGVVTSSGIRRLILSSAIFSFRGVWTLLTAGHVLLMLRKAIEDGKDVNTKLIDAWAVEGNDDTPVPFHFDIEQVIAIDNDAVDFGFMYINENAKSLLEVNGVRPIDERHWNFDPDDEKFDCCALIGLPEKSLVVTSQNASEVQMVVSPEIIRLDHQFVVPEEVRKHGAPVWYGRIKRSVHDELPHPVNGMSGGPVIGYKKKSDGSIWYQIIGIQNAIHHHGEYTYFRVTPVRVVGELLEQAIHKFEKTVEADSGPAL